MKNLGKRTSFLKRKLQHWNQINAQNVNLIYMYVPGIFDEFIVFDVVLQDCGSHVVCSFT